MDDYISRKAAVDAFFPVDPENDGSDGATPIYLERNYSNNEIESILWELPAADVEPVRRWIPCSERLPETDGPYLVVNKATGWIGVYNFSRVKNFPYFGPQENAWWRLDDDWYPQSCNATHWMPLPEPPEEE